jgi:pullulanase-type alpha-1,6-glucosidase
MRKIINNDNSGTIIRFRHVTGILLAGISLTLWAGHTPDPSSVTIAGSLQSELGCPGDWQPDCSATHLNFDGDDTVWQGVFNVPTGSWEYKAPLNDSWDENYGQGGIPGGANIPLNLGADSDVKFYYDHKTHWITDNLNSVIATVPGNFQDELGCPGDWQPDCLRSWLQDPDGDGIFTFAAVLPGGDYEAKVAISESWDLNYGDGGVQNGPNIPFNVPGAFAEMLFSFDNATKILTVGLAPPPAQPASVTIAGSLQDELGCPGDWQPDCAATHLGFDAEDTVWQGVFAVPAGDWEYKAALNDSWDVNYGANATQNGPNIGLSIGAPTDIKFYYDHATHWVTDNVNAYQDELGCSGDWQPWCLRSWLQDPDGDGIYSFSVELPAGNYEAKVAHDEDWSENYGQDGVPGGANIPFTVSAPVAEVFFTYDPVSHILTIGTGPGDPVGNLAEATAHWVAEDIVAWSAGSEGDTFALHYAAIGGLSLDETGVIGGDGSLLLTYDPAGLPAAVTDKFPHLAGFSALRLDPGDLAMVPDILKGQTAVSVADPGGNPVDATSLQIPGVLDDLYAYDGALGPVFDGDAPTLKLWAPTAKNVNLLVFDDADPATAPTPYPMLQDPTTGVWSLGVAADLKGKYYLYDVQVYVPSTGQVEQNLVTDPYSLSLSMNSQRSQIVNLADVSLQPADWSTLAKPILATPEDIVIYELHVRDFSANDLTVPDALKGTFKAFTLEDTDGTDHLEALAAAGLTHVHLLPSFDIASVDEDKSTWQQPDPAVLAAFPPDSDQQQALVTATADLDGFNWGYDPWHYTTPEGSYATNPNGAARIVEFREMVQALNQDGLRVVMDVVYNHTNAAGQNEKSVLDRVVPGYYHRLNAKGAIETSTCCANTASEHAMMEKLMIDSLVTWAREYKVDGFRFDLMGHHSKANLLNIRAALDALTLQADGVDGASIYLYGEGWNFGEVANNTRFEQATQTNMAGTGIGTFSDRTRDGIRGGNPFSHVHEQGFINGLCYDSNGYPQGDECATLRHISDWVRAGLAGGLADYQFENSSGSTVPAHQLDYFGQQAGYTMDPQEYISYAAAHDNETLFDATQLKADQGTTTMEERLRIQSMGNSLVMLGQGIPFFHAGQDILRSKSMDRDSYNSGDWFNAVDWSLATSNWGHGLPVADKNQDSWPIHASMLGDPALAPETVHMEHSAALFRELLQVRKSSKLFRLEYPDQIMERVVFHNTGPFQIPGLIVMSIADDHGDIDLTNELIMVLFNASDDPLSFGFPANGREFSLHPVQADSVDTIVQSAYYDAGAGAFNVPARTTAVFLVQRAIGDQIDLLLDEVDTLETAGVVNGGQANSLTSKLKAAQKSAANGRSGPAANQISAFINHVEALVAEGVLSPEEGEMLIAIAEAILLSLG